MIYKYFLISIVIFLTWLFPIDKNILILNQEIEDIAFKTINFEFEGDYSRINELMDKCDKENYLVGESELLASKIKTAIALGEFASKGRKRSFDDIKVFDRTNKNEKRKTGNIGFSVSRGGEIPGDHTVSFIGQSDRIDLSHKAFNRSIFVRGAIEAAIFLSQKKTGLYSMEDVIKV